VAAPAPLPLSVVIIARNEAHNLPRCLTSVSGWVAETVVVLNQTTDDSEAVAARHGAVVFQTEWRGFRDTKNWALDQATHQWVLALDADEEVSAELRAELEAFFQRGDHERFAGARFPRKVWFIDRWIKHGDWYPDLSLRLLHRGQARWGGDEFVHEKVEADGPVATLRGDLHHYPYPSLSVHQRKIAEYAGLFARQRSEAGATVALPAIFGRSFWRFVRGYLFKGGFLDGFPGFVAAMLTTHYTFLRYACLYELNRQKGRSSRRESPRS
jgi:glycosyltransferase involved in cell wall biosynthesis